MRLALGWRWLAAGVNQHNRGSRGDDGAMEHFPRMQQNGVHVTGVAGERASEFASRGIVVNAACGLIGLLAGNRLTLGRDRILKRENDIKADKLELIPLIENFITEASFYPAPNAVRIESIRELGFLHLRFRIHLKGRRLRRFNEAWSVLEQTIEAEMCGSSRTGVFADDQEKELHQVQQVLISRLQALLDSVEKHEKPQ